MPNEPAVSGANPRQFGIIDLFAILTLAALGVAMVAPIIRGAQTNAWIVFLLAAGLQLGVLAITVYWMLRRRAALLQIAGQRIGIGYRGEIAWRHWPVVKSALLMGLVAVLQLGFALLIVAMTELASNPLQPLKQVEMLQYIAMLFMTQSQLGYFSGRAILRFVWRVYPNSMEFFENGISTDTLSLLAWEHVDIRRGQYQPERIVVIRREPQQGIIVGSTTMVQVTDELREQLLSQQRDATSSTVTP